MSGLLNIYLHLDVQWSGRMEEKRFATKQGQHYSTQNRRSHPSEQKITSGGRSLLVKA